MLALGSFTLSSAQSFVVLDNSLTACAYEVTIYWGDISDCTTSPAVYDCDSPTSSSVHNVNGYQTVNVSIPSGANGPCQIVVKKNGGVVVASCQCSRPECFFENVTDCQTLDIDIDVTQAWTVKWTYG